MRIEINNKYKRYLYFDKASYLLHENIWDFLSLKNIRKANLVAHEDNSLFFIWRPDQYKEVVQGIIPIPPRSRWLYDGKYFTSNNNPYISQDRKTDFPEFLKACSKLIEVIKDIPIAVELSGGLDTSIIIGLLEHFNIKPNLIGMKNERYEFRTERIIQNIYADKFEGVRLLNNEVFPPFSNLTKTPVHQLPLSTSIFHAMENHIAMNCKEKGIKIVFNGNGFDALFCDSPIIDGNHRHPDSWFSWMLDNNWFNEYIFSDYGIEYKSPATKLLIQIIWLLRQEEQEDLKKIWARKYFAKFLPKELANYTYKADHVGIYMDGLWNSINEISELFKVAYDITSNERFKPSAMNALLNNVQKNDDKQDKLIMAHISFANWIYGLKREHKI